MSTEFPRRPEKLNEAVRFAIVASEYNRTYVDGLVRFASDELKSHRSAGRNLVGACAGIV